MFFIDLDKFKQANDTHGHEFGNDILAITAARMEKCLRSCDVLARYAGDEFVVYLDGKVDGISQGDCSHIARKLIEAVEGPITHQGEVIKISLSIGISIFPNNGSSYGSLIDCADKAMYTAKKQNDLKYCFADVLTSIH